MSTTHKSNEESVNLALLIASPFGLRGPLNDARLMEGWPPVTYERLEEHLECLREQGQLEGETCVNGNPHAVRLAAAATAELAFEYMDETGQYVGVLTKQLVAVLRDLAAQSVSWRTALFRVRELVNSEFPQSIRMLKALPSAFSSRQRSAMLCHTLALAEASGVRWCWEGRAEQKDSVRSLAIFLSVNTTSHLDLANSPCLNEKPQHGGLPTLQYSNQENPTAREKDSAENHHVRALPFACLAYAAAG
ncbi:hypothetical protein BKA80DRAFT_256140 [Phyllosticta citrichinensis]